jgi:hypothetical protein
VHRSVLTWIEQMVKAERCYRHSVLEVGSLDVNGSVRRFFGGPYVGVDMRDGPGVDIVLDAHDLSDEFIEHPPFEVIVCTEMLEHDSQPWTTLKEMRAVAAQDATLLITARGFDSRGCFPVHDYPQDLWRFSPAGMLALLEWAGWRPVTVTPDPEAPGVFALAYG